MAVFMAEHIPDIFLGLEDRYKDLPVIEVGLLSPTGN